MMQDFEMVMAPGLPHNLVWPPWQPASPLLSLHTHVYTLWPEKDLLNQHHIMAWFHVVCPLSTSATICCTQFGPWTPMHGISYHLPPRLTPLLPLSLHPPLLPSAHHHTDEGAVRQRWWRRWRRWYRPHVLQNGKTRCHRSYATISLTTIQSIKTRISRSNHSLR